MQAPAIDISRFIAGRPLAPNPPGAPRGLYVIPEWITVEEEQGIVNFLSANQWSNELSGKRPTQHYGYRYTLNGYAASQEKLPTDWGVLRKHADRLETEFPGVKIAQCLANAYYKDTGIGAHRDRETPLVFGVSVAGDINMRWSNIQNPALKYEALIPARSLYIMSEDAAYTWEHGIPVLATVRYPDPQNGNQLTKIVKKPDWYVRASITYRHFDHPIGNDRLQVVPIQQPIIVESKSNLLPYLHLKQVIPRHAESEGLLFAEIPWMTMKSRFGSNLSRQVCGSADKLSRTAGIYACWVQLYCDRVFNVKVEVLDGFANLYPTGKSALPAHRDQYDCWIFGLSFGETRTFDFVTNNPKDTISIEMHSGDVVMFAPHMNDTHKHRILAEPKRLGRRINVTYFIRPLPNQNPAGLLKPNGSAPPSFEEAQAVYQQQIRVQPNAQITNVQRIEVFEEENGSITANVNGMQVNFNTLEELMLNLQNQA